MGPWSKTSLDLLDASNLNEEEALPQAASMVWTLFHQEFESQMRGLGAKDQLH